MEEAVAKTLRVSQHNVVGGSNLKSGERRRKRKRVHKGHINHVTVGGRI